MRFSLKTTVNMLFSVFPIAAATPYTSLNFSGASEGVHIQEAEDEDIRKLTYNSMQAVEVFLRKMKK